MYFLSCLSAHQYKSLEKSRNKLTKNKHIHAAFKLEVKSKLEWRNNAVRYVAAAAFSQTHPRSGQSPAQYYSRGSKLFQILVWLQMLALGNHNRQKLNNCQSLKIPVSYYNNFLCCLSILLVWHFLGNRFKILFDWNNFHHIVASSQ